MQINNAASGTVYITDDAAVDASMLDWLHRQEDATANTIPEHYAPMSSAYRISLILVAVLCSAALRPRVAKTHANKYYLAGNTVIFAWRSRIWPS